MIELEWPYKCILFSHGMAGYWGSAAGYGGAFICWPNQRPEEEQAAAEAKLIADFKVRSKKYAVNMEDCRQQ